MATRTTIRAPVGSSLRVGVVGSRTFNDRVFLFQQLDTLLKGYTVTAIVSGGAAGADTLAEEYASRRQIEMIVFKPEKFTRECFFARNTDIVNSSDVVVAFSARPYGGTQDTLRKARRKGIQVIEFKCYKQHK